nr:MAG TPA: hypothetical protein [Caudoviricetes sp.]
MTLFSIRLYLQKTITGFLFFLFSKHEKTSAIRTLCSIFFAN